MAQRTGLEPATPGVTGRYSNQLNYRCLGRFRIFNHFLKIVVGDDRLELPTFCV